jgi:hypothetical protein
MAQEGREQRQRCGQICHSARRNNDFSLSVESQTEESLAPTISTLPRRANATISVLTLKPNLRRYTRGLGSRPLTNS